MYDVTNLINITRINGSVARGGWEMRFTVPNDTDLFIESQRVAATWRPALGGSMGELRTAFIGYTLPRRYSFDGKSSVASYIARTSDKFLEKGWVQGIDFSDTDAVARVGYHEFDSVTGGGGGVRMTMGRIVQHLLGYYDELGTPPATNPDWVSHTSMVFHATENPDGWIRLDGVTTTPFDDPANPDGTMRVNRYIVEETTNLWKTLQSIAANEFFIVGFDKMDTLYYRRHPIYQETLPDPRVEITAAMIIGSPTVTVLPGDTISQVRLHAVTDIGDTLHAYRLADSDIFSSGPKIDISYLRCNSQTTLNWWALRRYYYETRDVEVTITLPGLCGLLFELYDRVSITYTGTAANGVDIDWTAKKFWVQDITVIPDNSGGGQSTLTLEAENLAV